MTIRWLVKADGTTVLQRDVEARRGSGIWEDVPTIPRDRQEPRKAREFILARSKGDTNWVIQDLQGFAVHSMGEMGEMIKVREVLDDR